MSTIVAFTPDQACRVSGLTRRQLAYWDKTGFFHPRMTTERARFSRMYSYRDVVGLRAIATLRDKVPLQQLRRVGQWLYDRHEEPWSRLRFQVFGREVVFEDESGIPRVAGTDQVVLSILMTDVEQDASRAARQLLEREPDQIGNIVRARNVQHNAWVLDGTRIPTSAILDFHEAGYTTKQILQEYPRLTQRDVESALSFEASRAQRAS